MRAPLAMLASTLAVPAFAAGPTSTGKTSASAICQHPSPHIAAESSLNRDKPLTPQFLTQLPKGTAYMAVYRRIDGCEVPLTMVDYRNARRR